jgi:conjugative transposon TraM protein
MEKKNQSAKQLRQRKFLMILPFLTVPFLTLMFWALGGGKGSDANAQTSLHAGINLKLPDAKFKDDRHFDKLSFYQQAALDSAKTKEAEKLDPYWSNSLSHFNDSPGNEEKFSLTDGGQSLMNDYGVDANKMKVYGKLDELKKALNNSQASANYNQQIGNRQYSMQQYSSSNDAERLQAMMQKMKEDKSEDPEINQLNSMLDKIIAIQNPDQVVDSNKNVKSTNFFSVKTKNQKASVSLLKHDTTKTFSIDTNIQTAENGFFSDAKFSTNDEATNNNAIEATIPETQTVVTGATIKLVLSNDVTVNDMQLPSGTLIYGIASLSNERLKISITSIRFQNSILPVSLEVYDMDGQEGIYVPGSINRTVAKESANNAVSGIGTTTVDNSVGAEAASAGIEVAKTLFSKKVKLIKLTVNAGYKVLLRDSHDK